MRKEKKMFSLSTSPKFLKDYNSLQVQIETIQDIDTKSKLNGMLRQLRLEVQRLDTHHKEISPSSALGQKAHDTRDKIQNLRRQIVNGLKDYKEAH